MDLASLQNEIKASNSNINLIISNIVELMKENNFNAVEFVNNEPVLRESSKTILVSELKKVLMIYEAEFSYIKNRRNYDEEVTVKKGNEIDAYGHQGGMKVSSGTTKGLKSVTKEANYGIDKEGRFNAIEGNDSNIVPIDVVIINDGSHKPYLINGDELLENDIKLKDYLSYLCARNSIDLDFFLDVLPHEAMHVFGFSNEGVTESFTREVAQKYNLRTVPFAHQEETRFIQKIEKLTGRTAVAEAFYGKGYTKKEKYKILANDIENILGIKDERGIFLRIDSLLSDREMKKAENELRTFNGYFNQIPESTYYILGKEQIKPDSVQKEDITEKLKEVVDFQNYEMTLLKDIESSLRDRYSEYDSRKNFKNSLREHVNSQISYEDVQHQENEEEVQSK